MFINNSEVEFRLSAVLEMFLYCVAEQNKGIFFNRDNQKLNYWFEEIENFIPNNNLAIGEEYLVEVIKSELLYKNSNDNYGLLPNTKKLLTTLQGLLNNNVFFNLNDNMNYYKNWWLRVKTCSKIEIPKLIEHETSQTVSNDHNELILKSKKVVVIPSFFVYPQIGFNSINETVYLLIGLTTNNKQITVPYDSIAQGFRALGEEKRLEILNIIATNNGIQSKEIAKIVSLTPATVSHHINILVQAGIISRQRQGRDISLVLEKPRLDFLSTYLNKIG